MPQPSVRRAGLLSMVGTLLSTRFREGVPINVIRDQLGHSSLAVTDRYLRKLSGIASAGSETAGQQFILRLRNEQLQHPGSPLTRDATTPSLSDARTSQQKGKINYWPASDGCQAGSRQPS
jgi:hypothetical protein